MPDPIPDLTATEWDQVYEIVSKRLNNLPNVAGAYWWVTQSLKRDMSFTTFKKLLCAERKRNPRWSANLNAAAAAASPPAPSPPAPPNPLEPAALGAPADFAATASAPHRVTCASDSVASVSASAGESSCVAGDLSPLPVDAEDLAAVSVGHQGAASDAVEAPRTPSMSRGASGKVLRMSPTCHRLPSMRAAPSWGSWGIQHRSCSPTAGNHKNRHIN